jgi:hypothetical protein
MTQNAPPPAAPPPAAAPSRSQPSAAAPPTGGDDWRYWVGTAAAVFLGALYLVAAWAKAIAPDAFVEQIRFEGLDFLLPAAVVAGLAFALEGALGVALLLALRRLWVLVPTVLLTVFFLALNLRSWWLASRGLREDALGCGCFGNLVERTPQQALLQDALLLGVPTLLVFLGRPRGGRRFPPLRTALVVLAAAAVPLFAWMAPSLPLDDLATRLHPGVELSALCAGSGDDRVCLDLLVPELAAGDHLVVMARLDDAAFTSAVDRLNAYAANARGGGAAPLWVLAPGTAEEHRAFFWTWAPVFQVREVPEEVLKPLYRTLPRSFRVEDGVVTDTWSGLPDLPPAPEPES